MTDHPGVPPQPYLAQWDERIVALQRENARLRADIREALEMCDPRETRSFHIGLVLRRALESKP